MKAISLKRLRYQPGFSRMSDRPVARSFTRLLEASLGENAGRLHQEIEILLSLKHKHIVKLVDVVHSLDQVRGDLRCLLLDLDDVKPCPLLGLVDIGCLKDPEYKLQKASNITCIEWWTIQERERERRNE